MWWACVLQDTENEKRVIKMRYADMKSQYRCCSRGEKLEEKGW